MAAANCVVLARDGMPPVPAWQTTYEVLVRRFTGVEFVVPHFTIMRASFLL